MSVTDDQKENYNTITKNLEKLTNQNCNMEIHIKEMNFFVQVLTGKPLELVEAELRTWRCEFKVSKDEQALTIYMLNGNSIHYTKRLKQFKRHMREYLDCFLDLEIFNVDDYPEYRDVVPPWSFTHKMKTQGSEKYYIKFCKEQRGIYNFFCAEYTIKFMSKVSWKNRHFLM